MTDEWAVLGPEENKPAELQIFIRVRQVGSDRWTAEISDGWWVATGTTKKGAIDAVLKRYEQETGKFFA